MFDTSMGFTLTRTFDATPEEVWTAWTDPDSAAQWWHVHGTSTPREAVEIDARVGGHYTYAMVGDATGDKIVSGGVYREVTPFERLVFTWGNPNDDPADAPIITISLEPVQEGTRMTFDLRGVDGAKGDGFFYDGWEEVLDFLEDYYEAMTVSEDGRIAVGRLADLDAGRTTAVSPDEAAKEPGL